MGAVSDEIERNTVRAVYGVRDAVGNGARGHARCGGVYGLRGPAIIQHREASLPYAVEAAMGYADRASMLQEHLSAAPT